MFKAWNLPLYLWALVAFIWLLAALTSCASIPAAQKLDQNIFYKRDMLITVDGISREGVLVAPAASRHSFDVSAKGKLDLFTFETCHREETREKAGQGGLFSDKRRVQFSYIPSPGIETEGACPVKLGGYEQSGGRHSWAMIDFESADATLPARVKCNGENYSSRGVTICQSRVGLIQEIIFPAEVIVNPDPACPMERPKDLKAYRFSMPPRECVFNFMEKAEPHREHRLTTVGYDGILVREN